MTSLQVIVFALSFALFLALLDGQRWRRHTASANRRRKSVEQSVRAVVKDSEQFKDAYDARGDVLRKTAELRARAMDKIVALNKEAAEREQFVESLREGVRLLTGSQARLQDKYDDLSRNFEIEVATTKAQRRDLAAAHVEVDRQKLTIVGQRADIDRLFLRVQERSRAVGLMSRIVNMPAEDVAISHSRFRLLEKRGGKWVLVEKSKRAKAPIALVRVARSAAAAVRKAA